MGAITVHNQLDEPLRVTVTPKGAWLISDLASDFSQMVLPGIGNINAFPELYFASLILRLNPSVGALIKTIDTFLAEHAVTIRPRESAPVFDTDWDEFSGKSIFKPRFWRGIIRVNDVTLFLNTPTLSRNAMFDCSIADSWIAAPDAVWRREGGALPPKRSGGSWDWNAAVVPAPKLASIAAGSAAYHPNNLDVFGVAPDGTVHHNWVGDSGWHSWRRDFLGAPKARMVAVTTIGRLDAPVEVFLVARDGSVHHNECDQIKRWGQWQRWVNAPSLKSLTLAPASDRLHHFGIGTDDHLWHCTRENRGGWSSWERDLRRLGRVTSVAAAESHNGHLQVFAIGQDSRLAHNWFDGEWHDWTREPFGAARGVQYVTLGSQRAGALKEQDLFVFAVDTRGRLSMACLERTGGWKPFDHAFGPAGVEVSKVFAGSNRGDSLEICGTRVRGGLIRRRYVAPGWGRGWEPWSDEPAAPTLLTMLLAERKRSPTGLEVFGIAPDQTVVHNYVWLNGVWVDWKNGTTLA